MSTIKEKAKEVVDSLPENATWEDLLYQVYVRERIEKGLEAAKLGHTKSQEEIEKKFGVK